MEVKKDKRKGNPLQGQEGRDNIVRLDNAPHYVDLSSFTMAAEYDGEKLTFYPYEYEKGEKCAYVYAIQIDDDMYVGSAYRLVLRIKSHYKDLQLGRHHAPRLQQAFDEKHRFKVFVIMRVTSVKTGNADKDLAENLAIRLLTPSANTQMPRGKDVEAWQPIWHCSRSIDRNKETIIKRPPTAAMCPKCGAELEIVLKKR
jgi:hypothetical protein